MGSKICSSCGSRIHQDEETCPVCNHSFRQSFNFVCISGLPKYDKMAEITNQPYNVHSIIHIQVDGLKIEAISYKAFSSSKYDVLASYIIPAERIQTVDVITQKNIEEKQKSIVGRGILGAVAFGPVGAIVGGMSGIGSKSITTASSTLCIVYETKGGGYSNIVFDIKPTMVDSNPYEFVKCFNEKFGRQSLVSSEEANENGEILL